MYGIALFVHVAAAIGVFAALGVEWALVERLAASSVADHVALSLGAFAALPRIGAPATILVVLSGIYLTTVSSLWTAGWPVAALVGMAAIGALGGILGSGRVQRVMRAPAAERAAAATAAVGTMRGSVLARSWIGLAIVYLMTIRPGAAGSTVALGAALVLTAATLMGSRRGGAALGA